MGRNELEPGKGGSWRMTCFGDYSPEHRVAAWEPGERVEYRSEEAPDGRLMAYEFLIEGRGQGSTTLRMVASGFLPGDDWAEEYEAMTKGGALFFHTLVTYLNHFAGRTATPVTAFGPPVRDWDQAWARLHHELGLTGPVSEGDAVHCTPDGLPPIDGVVYFTNSDTLGVRTDDALYRFLKGFHGPMIAAHHLFSDSDPQDTELAWQAWLNRVFAQSTDS